MRFYLLLLFFVSLQARKKSRFAANVIGAHRTNPTATQSAMSSARLTCLLLLLWLYPYPTSWFAVLCVFANTPLLQRSVDNAKTSRSAVGGVAGAVVLYMYVLLRKLSAIFALVFCRDFQVTLVYLFTRHSLRRAAAIFTRGVALSLTIPSSVWSCFAPDLQWDSRRSQYFARQFQLRTTQWQRMSVGGSR